MLFTGDVALSTPLLSFVLMKPSDNRMCSWIKHEQLGGISKTQFSIININILKTGFSESNALFGFYEYQAHIWYTYTQAGRHLDTFKKKSNGKTTHYKKNVQEFQNVLARLTFVMSADNSV